VLLLSSGHGRWRFLPEVEAEEIRGNLEAPALAAAFLTRAFFLDFITRNSGAIVQVMSPGLPQAHDGINNPRGSRLLIFIRIISMWQPV